MSYYVTRQSKRANSDYDAAMAYKRVGPLETSDEAIQGVADLLRKDADDSLTPTIRDGAIEEWRIKRAEKFNKLADQVESGEISAYEVEVLNLVFRAYEVR